MRRNLKKCLYALVCASLVFNSFAQTAQNQLTAAEKKEGWQLLFDGKTTNGWHLYNRGKVSSIWVAKNGELYCEPDNEEAGDLVTDQEFGNFELKFDWKISEGGNSGVFINVQERSELPRAWTSGPEYQLLEKSNPDHNLNPKKRAGCLFNLYPQKNPAPSKPAGQWNQSRIRQVNGKVEFYLNGVLTAKEDFGSEAWKKLVSESPFKTFPEFGKHRQGHIGLQYWSKVAAFRNIRIRKL